MLAVDIGNTRIKTALFDAQGQCLSIQAFSHRERKLVIDQMQAVGSGMVSNVSALNDQDFLLPGFRLLTAKLPLPIEIDYHGPETLGSDRLALACGAVCRYPGENILVISAGTCITYDLIENGRIYRGGAISPGLRMRFQSLHHFTGRLPELEPSDDCSFPGKSTQQNKCTFYRLKNPPHWRRCSWLEAFTTNEDICRTGFAPVRTFPDQYTPCHLSDSATFLCF